MSPIVAFLGYLCIGLILVAMAVGIVVLLTS